MDKMHGPTDQEMEFRDLNYVDLKAINTVIHVATKEANHIERKRL